MERDRWEQIERFYYSALERGPDARGAFLDEACAGDEELRREVASLLNYDGPDSFFDAPVLGLAAQMQAEEQIAEMFDSQTPTHIGLSKLKPGSSTVTSVFIGDYRILRRLGEGGMGVVYEAEQQHPRRPVALKVIRGGQLVGEYQVKLFQREVQALARLKHPGIAAIYEAGRTEDGQHYFVMELVRGITLLDYVKGGRLKGKQAPSSVRDRLELFLKICEAISYAHQRGVIHRDLKPANILVADESEEQSLSGSSASRIEVKVLDFGLARVTDEDGAGTSGLSQAGQIRGTLPYMSPEQVRGATDQIDVRVDVYALGVILYEVLTEQLPFEFKHTTVPQAIRIICEESPKSPSQVRSESRDRESGKAERIDRDVETIVLKALEKDPERRYQSVAAMAEDVTRYLTNQPIHARAPSAFYQFRKLIARHKGPFAFLVAVFTLLLGFAIMMAVQSARIAQERDKVAQKELSNRRLLYAAHMNMALHAWEASDFVLMQELLESHIPKLGDEDIRGFEFYYLWRLCHRDILTLKGHLNTVASVAFSPDGKRLASGSGDRTVRLWDTATGRELTTLGGHSEWISSVAFSPDGKKLATGSGDRTVKLWDTTTGQELVTLKGHEDRVSSLAFSPDGKRLATVDRTLKIWDAATGQNLATFRGHEDVLGEVAFSPDGKKLATGSGAHTAKLWDAITGRELIAFIGHSAPVNSVAFSPDGKRLATGSSDRTAKLWDAATGQELATLRGHEDRVSSLAFSPDGARLATGSGDRTVKLWNTFTGQELGYLKGDNGEILSVAFSRDGERLAIGSSDRTVKLWSSHELTALKGHSNVVTSVAFSPDGKRLATGSGDHTVKLWDPITGQELVTLRGYSGEVNFVAFSPDGKMLATGGHDPTVKLWDVATGQELIAVKVQGDWASSVAFSPDGKMLATSDRTVKLWDVATGQEFIALKVQGHRVESVAFSPDGKRLAIGSVDRTVKLCDVATGQEIATLRGHTDVVRSVAFSPDGRKLASGSQDRTIKIWDATTGQEFTTFRGHTNGVNSVVFSPDGKRLATGSYDRTVRIWDVATGQELITLKGQIFTIHSVAFSPDGKMLAAGSGDGMVGLWSAATEQEVLSKTKL